MVTQLLLDDRKGNIHELPHSEVKFTTKRNGRAGSLEFTFVGGDVFTLKIKPKNGNIVLFKKDDKAVFYGYVFKVNADEEKTKVICYDQIRYLKNKDIKIVTNKTTTELLRMIATENNLKVGQLVDTGYKVPKLDPKEREYLDMIYESLQETVLATGRLYFLRDNVGSLELLDIRNTKIDLVIDGDTLLTSYTHGKDIDSDTYNYIKLARENKKKGTRELFVTRDTNSISNWGRLQYFRTVDENMNEAQIMEIAQALLKLKNREKRSLKLDNIIGDIRAQAGFSVFISIPEENINQYFLIDQATHKFDDNEHLMSIELVVL